MRRRGAAARGEAARAGGAARAGATARGDGPPGRGDAAPSGERLDGGYFESLYRDREDPWGFATSGYERDKYRRTLAALGDRRPARALELGCSIGVFTELLAARCGELLAVDVAPTAVERARARLDGIENVRVERRSLPEELPPGPWDLVVCSEILYYWSRPLLERALSRIEAALAPGGALLAVHWRPATRTYPLLGDEVHDLLSERRVLAHALGERTPEYRLDLYQRR